MFFTPLLPGGVIGTDTGTLRRQVKVKRKTQPNQSMTIDWSNPITKGLIFAYNGVTNTDLVKGSRGDQQNIAVDSIGQGTNISASLDAVTINNVNNLPTTNNLSLFSLFTTTVSPAAQSATSYYAGVFSKRTTNNTRGPAIFFGGGTLLFTSNNSVGTNTDTTLSGSITSTGRTTICVTGSLSGSVGYVNGKQTGTGIVPYWPANTDPWYIGIIATPGPTTAYLSAVHHLDLCWNRTLTAAEVSSLNANPWQLFKSTPQTMVATRGIVSRPNSDLSVTNNTITIRRQIKVKRKTQPNQSMTIDWSNPIANGLIFAYNGVTNTDLVKRAKGDKQNIAVDSIGQGTNITGSADVVTISARNNTPVTNNLSFFSLFTTTTSPKAQSATIPYGGLFCKRSTIGVPGPSMYFYAGRLSITTNDSIGTRSDFSFGGDVTSTGRTTACVTGSLSGCVGYINGKQRGTGIVPYWPANTDPWYIGLIRADATTENLQAIHHLDLCWNRTLTPAEVASLDANPWQLFKSTPVLAMVYTKPGGGWSYNSNTSLYDAIDEPSYNDTDAIISPSLNASPEIAKFGLDTSLDAGTYNVNVRARKTDTTGDIRATLIDSAGNVVGTSSWQTLTDVYQTYVLSVTTTATASRVGLEVRA